MTKLPFQLSIKPASGKESETITCTRLLRTIPDNRQVYEGQWNDRSIIAKIFSHKIKARLHFEKEWRSLKKLEKLEINSPKLLFSGKTKQNRWAVVVEKLGDCSTLYDIFLKTDDDEKKNKPLIMLSKEIAEHHRKGIFQKDFHLGNFLLSDEKIYTLDPSQISFSKGPISRKKSIFQLASLANHLNNDTEINKLCTEYGLIRGWNINDSDKKLLQKYSTIQKKTAIKSALKKCMRTSQRYIREKIANDHLVFKRDFCNRTDAITFTEQIDTLMDSGKILKNGNTCYLSKLSWNNKEIVVKRYNHKGFFHSLRHTIKGSRARGAWLWGHRLGLINVATPLPLAYYEKRKGPLIWNSYIVTEYVEAENLYKFIADKNINQQLTEQIKELLDKLGSYKISHGDLKPSNILITETGPILTDLDAMKTHKCRWIYKIKRAKDIKRVQILQSST